MWNKGAELQNMDDHFSASPSPSIAHRAVRRRPVVLTGLLGVASLAGCGSLSSKPRPASTDDPGTMSPTAAPEDFSTESAPAASASATPNPLDGWTLEQKVGQLLMVGADTSGPQMVSIDAVATHHVGNVFIARQTRSGADSVRGVITALTDLVGSETTHDTPLLVATDQEGGQVQVLGGSGFSDIPSASEQAIMSTDDLTASARTWGQELADVGVTMNLAPVADLVDIPDPSSNAPIGRWGREYGQSATTSQDRAIAFARGMEAAGVIPTYKHFPGLGRVTANTDTADGVTDSITTRSGDPAVSVFAEAITGGARVIMVSSAIYSAIDSSAPATFSSVVVTDMLRGDLGFTGVVITDDVSAAVQVDAWTPAERAVQAVKAGCDIVLASADATMAADMAEALIAEAQADPAFAQRVDESATRVISLKAGS